MTNYHINFFEYLRSFPLHSLVFGEDGTWQTADGEDWVGEDGIAWGTGGYNIHLAWIKSMLAPLQSLNVRLVDFVEDVRYHMHLTGQVIYLEHYLNDLFDPAERRIYIEDDTPTLPVHLFNKADGLSLTIYNKADAEPPLFIYNAADFVSQFDFIVFVPSAISLTSTFTSQASAAINRYKQAGKRYNFENF